MVSSVVLLAIKRLIYYIVYLSFSLLREEIVKDIVCLIKSTVFLDIGFTNIVITLIQVCMCVLTCKCCQYIGKADNTKEKCTWRTKCHGTTRFFLSFFLNCVGPFAPPPFLWDLLNNCVVLKWAIFSTQMYE